MELNIFQILTAVDKFVLYQTRGRAFKGVSHYKPFATENETGQTDHK